MKQNDSELEREIKRLKKIKTYEIIMCISIFLAMLFIILWIVTLIRLDAQKKLRGDFKHISLVIKLTSKLEDNPLAVGEILLPQEETFELYGGPYIDKGYYGLSLGNYLETDNASKYFHIQGGMLNYIYIPQINDLPSKQEWIIYSYSERNVDGNHRTSKGISEILLDRVNVFVFQLNNPL